MLQRIPVSILIGLTLLTVLLVATVDLLTGLEISFFVFYFIPVGVAVWNVSFRFGLVVAILCPAAWLVVDLLSEHPYSNPALIYINAFIRWISYTCMGWFVAKLKDSRLALRSYADTLEERVAERTASLQARVAEIEMFSYTVSHNLRGPLRALEGVSQMLGDAVAQNDRGEAAELLDRIKAAAVRMDRLILDLVEYTQLSVSETNPRPVLLGPLVSEVIHECEPLIREKSAVIKIESEFPQVLGDNRMLRSVLLQLVVNSLTFVAPGVAPVVSIGSTDLPGGRTRCWIRDNGIGIAQKHQERIFGLFERLHPFEAYGGGTGIGLAAARKAIEKMGGNIGCESDGERGATFWFELPRPQQRKEPR